MKITIFKNLVFLFIISLSFSGCYFDNLCVRGDGSIKSEERVLRSFTKIELQIDADIYLRQSKFQEVIIDAQHNVLDEIETYVRNGVLYIDYDKCVREHDGVEIIISMPFIDGLKNSSSGNIYCEGPITTEDLILKIPGSGNIYIPDLVADNVTTTITGSGDLKMAGPDVAYFHDIRISGSGHITANKFRTDKIEVDISGSGSCWIYALEEIYGAISGSGDVYHVGQPEIDILISGSGRVKRDD